MSDLTMDLFAEEADVPPVPPRSILYHCPVIDEGTPLQESLLNYLYRLAREHHLRVMDLLVQIVLPRTCVAVRYGKFRFASEYARTVNGYSKYATEISAALEKLTGRVDLRSATFLNWASLFDGKGAGLLHPTRAWCPDCLAEAEERGEPHNFPLLWACSSVTHCRTHLCALQTACLKCGAKQRPICDSSHYGRCGACGASLSDRSSLFQSERVPARQDFVVRGVGDMIALSAAAVNIARPENLRQGIQRAADEKYDGSVARLAEAVMMTPSTMVMWANGRKQPRFDSFIELCYRLGMSPLGLLGGSAPFPALPFRSERKSFARPSFKLSPEKLRAIADDIRHNLQVEDIPLTLAELATKHRTSVGHLRYQLPDACQGLIDRYRSRLCENDVLAMPGRLLTLTS